MADFADDLGMAELLAILAAIGVGGYFVYKYFKSATCITKVGAIPGVTGSTASQATAAVTASSTLKQGGKTIWSCGSDFDYLQPCQQIVTEARHSWLDYIPILNNWTGGPVKYTCVPVTCYCFGKTGVCKSAVAGSAVGCMAGTLTC